MNHIPNYSAVTHVSLDRHQAMTWEGFSDFRFAEHQHYVPIGINEAFEIAAQFPIVFHHGKGGIRPIALLSHAPTDSNQYVDPGTGMWRAEYVPAALRSYPFSAGKSSNDQFSLLVDEASGLVNPHGTGHAFFDKAGRLSERLKQVINFLQHRESSYAAARNAAQALSETGMLAPLDDHLSEPLGLDLHTIDIEKLGSVGDSVVLHLWHAGAIKLAHATFASRPNLGRLGKLNRRATIGPIKSPEPAAHRSNFLDSLRAVHSAEASSTPPRSTTP